MSTMTIDSRSTTAPYSGSETPPTTPAPTDTIPGDAFDKWWNETWGAKDFGALSWARPRLEKSSKHFTTEQLVFLLSKLLHTSNETRMKAQFDAIKAGRESKQIANNKELEDIRNAAEKDKTRMSQSKFNKDLELAGKIFAVIGSTIALGFAVAAAIGSGGLAIAAAVLAATCLVLAIVDLGNHIAKENGSKIDVSIGGAVAALAEALPPPPGVDKEKWVMGWTMAIQLGIAVASIATGVGAAVVASKAASLATKAADLAQKAADIAMDGMDAAMKMTKVAKILEKVETIFGKVANLAGGGKMVEKALKVVRDARKLVEQALKYAGKGVDSNAKAGEMAAKAAELVKDAAAVAQTLGKTGQAIKTISAVIRSVYELLNSTLSASHAGVQIAIAKTELEADSFRAESAENSKLAKEIETFIEESGEALQKLAEFFQELIAVFSDMLADVVRAFRQQAQAGAMVVVG